MKPKSIALTYAAVLGSACTLSTTAHALTETDSFQQGDGTSTFNPTYTAPANDVLLGLTPTTSVGDFTVEGSGGTPVLTDGVFGPIFTGGGPPHPSFATGGPGGIGAGSSLIYSFAPTAIDRIVTLGGWNDGGRDTQAYTVSYGIGGIFTTLATVNYDPTAGSGTGVQIATQVILDGFGVIANVDQLKFVFATAENGHQGYAELAATSSVPEPSAFAALAGGGVMLLGFRRRSA